MRQKPTASDKAFAFLIYLAIFVLVMIVIITVFDADGSWGLWIAKNKDLIVGIYAVGAAALTINQMKRTDAEQERRHRQLLMFTMRKEVMRIRRAYDPQVKDLKRLQPIFKRYLDAFEMENGDPRRIKVVNNPGVFWEATDELNEILEREQISDVKDLFDEAGLRSYQLARDQLLTVFNFVHRWKSAQEALYYDNNQWDYFDNEWDENKLYINSRIREMIANVDILCEQLTTLRDHFAGEVSG